MWVVAYVGIGLVLIIILGSSRQVMGPRTSGALSKSLTWIAAGVMGVAAIALVVTLQAFHCWRKVVVLHAVSLG